MCRLRGGRQAASSPLNTAVSWAHAGARAAEQSTPSPSPQPVLEGPRSHGQSLPQQLCWCAMHCPEHIMISAPSITSTLPQPGPGPAPLGKDKVPPPASRGCPSAAHGTPARPWLLALPRWYREWWPQLCSPLTGALLGPRTTAKAQSTHQGPEGIQAGPACSPSWGPLLPRRLTQGNREPGGTACAAPAAGGGARPSFQKNPHGRLQSCSAPRGEMKGRGVVLEEGKGLQRPPTPGITQLFPRACRVQTPGWASPHPGRGGAPSAVPSPQRSRNPSSAAQTPAPAPCPRGQQEGCGRKAGQGPGLSCSETFLFPDVVVVATGDPTLPAAPGPSPQPLQPGFLPVRACGGMTTGVVLAAREGRRDLESAPLLGPGSLSQPISFHCL